MRMRGGTTKSIDEQSEAVGSASGKGSHVPVEAIARIAFSIVLAWNLLCAFQFVFIPQNFAAAYELSGASGQAAIRGLGIAFLMWNATYPAFIARPRKHKALGIIILVQQAIGLIGETFLMLSLPAGHAVLSSSILRFIVFDGVGLVMMAAAFIALQLIGRASSKKGQCD